MSRGNVQSIPTGTQTLQRTLNAEVRATIRVLNPNDGIVYVAINGQASPVTFDFVVPSQSYAALPGPWMEYGLYFLDQSGAGRTGVVTIYESDERLDYPDYHAIGRSLQAQVTTVDITEGVQPANPPVGVARLWVDNTGRLFGLLSDGTLERLAITPVPGSDLAVPLDVGGFVRVNGTSAPVNGSGLELGYDTAAQIGYVEAYTRAPAITARQLTISGNPIVLNPSNGNLALNPWVAYVTLSGDLAIPVTTVTNLVTTTVPQAGNYLVMCWATFVSTSGGGSFELRLQTSDGGLWASTSGTLQGTSYLLNGAIVGQVSVASGVTIQLTAYNNVGTITAKAVGGVSGSARATGLVAVRLA